MSGLGSWVADRCADLLWAAGGLLDALASICQRHDPKRPYGRS